MKANEFVTEKWSAKYKKSINCAHPKGFSQKAHCAGRKKHNESIDPVSGAGAVPPRQNYTPPKTNKVQPVSPAVKVDIKNRKEESPVYKKIKEAEIQKPDPTLLATRYIRTLMDGDNPQRFHQASVLKLQMMELGWKPIIQGGKFYIQDMHNGKMKPFVAK